MTSVSCAESKGGILFEGGNGDENRRGNVPAFPEAYGITITMLSSPQTHKRSVEERKELVKIHKAWEMVNIQEG